MYKGLLNTVLIIAQMSPKPEMLGGQKFGRRSGPMHVQWAAMLWLATTSPQAFGE